MGRYPLLQGPDFPRGRLQPYIGAGPALFVTSIEDTRPKSDPNSLGSKSLTFGGFHLLAGVKFFLLKQLSLFAEYKFTHFTADLSGVLWGGTTWPVVVLQILVSVPPRISMGAISMVDLPTTFTDADASNQCLV